MNQETLKNKKIAVIDNREVINDGFVWIWDEEIKSAGETKYKSVSGGFYVSADKG